MTQTNHTKKQSSSPSISSGGILESMDKKQLIEGLNKTIKDMGTFPTIILKPIVAYISATYEKIPLARRKKLEEIITKSKEEGFSVFKSLKERFLNRYEDIENTLPESLQTKPTTKKSKKKRAPKKKTSSRSKKLSTTN